MRNNQHNVSYNDLSTKSVRPSSGSPANGGSSHAVFKTRLAGRSSRQYPERQGQSQGIPGASGSKGNRQERGKLMDTLERPQVEVSHYTYRVAWSAEDGEFVATVAEFPSLSWLASAGSSPRRAGSAAGRRYCRYARTGRGRAGANLRAKLLRQIQPSAGRKVAPGGGFACCRGQSQHQPVGCPQTHEPAIDFSTNDPARDARPRYLMPWTNALGQRVGRPSRNTHNRMRHTGSLLLSTGGCEGAGAVGLPRRRRSGVASCRAGPGSG